MAVAGYGYSDEVKDVMVNHDKTELFFHSLSLWKVTMSLESLKIKSISFFQIIAKSNCFILFGGRVPNKDIWSDYTATNIIAKFDLDLNKWERIGSLQTKRWGIGIIEVDSKFLLMGGKDSFLLDNILQSTEMCDFNQVSLNGTIDCIVRKPFPDIIHFYPALMIAPSDFANQC